MNYYSKLEMNHMKSIKSTIDLDPEVKWRSMISFFLNYIFTVHKIMTQELDKETQDRLNARFTREFWAEQAQAFIELFDLKPGDIKDVHSLKRIIAAILDIKYLNISEKENEITDAMEYKFCSLRTVLKPVWDNVCDFCEPWGQIMIDQLDPNFKHKVIISKNTCTHKTTRK